LTLRGGYTTTNWVASDPLANPTTLDAQGLGRVIVITGTVNASIEYLTVTRGRIDGISLCPVDCGGGIMATGALTLTNVNLINNRAERFGGGVAALLTTTVTSSRFEGNSAAGNFGSGGGLHAEGPVSIQGTVFMRNTSTSAGGGIDIQDSAISIADSSLVQNQSFFSWGGAVQVSFPTVISGPVSISGTTFISNLVGVSSTIQSGHGGAVATFNAHVTAINSRFENNRCVQERCDGGGLYVLGNTFFVTPVVTLSNTTFVNNAATRNGGGAAVSGLTMLTNGYFARNHTAGGTNAFSEGGGGLWTDGLILEATRFINNTSGEDGGGLNSFAALTVTNSLFQGNSSASNGGGLYAFIDPFVLSNTQFLSNTALNGGGLFFTFNPINAVDVLIQSNTAISNGGGLATSGSAILSGDWEVSNNTAGEDGGGIWANSRLIGVNGRIENNRSGGSGGGYYGGLALLLVDGTVFAGNRAGGDGWQGTLDAGHRKQWWVADKDLGTGPFRWVVYQDQAAPPLAASEPFYLPNVSGMRVKVDVTLGP